MSIKIENPKSVIEVTDAVSNLVEQMGLAIAMGDQARFETIKEKASKLLFDLGLRIEPKSEEIEQLFEDKEQQKKDESREELRDKFETAYLARMDSAEEHLEKDEDGEYSDWDTGLRFGWFLDGYKAKGE